MGAIATLAHLEWGSITSLIVLAILYMSAPAYATFIIQKFIYKEGFRQYGWYFDKKNYKWLLLAPVFFLALFLSTLLVVAALGNTHVISNFGQIDFSSQHFSDAFRDILRSKKVNPDVVGLPNISPVLVFTLIIIKAIVVGCTINVPFTFGEELGWRGLLLTETRRMGFLASNIFIGTIWGLWHLPLIIMGLNYPHHPQLGILMMCFFTISIAPVFAYVRLKAKSILAPSMLHGMINSSGIAFVLYVANSNELYSTLAGWAGIIAGITITLCICSFDREFVKNYAEVEICLNRLPNINAANSIIRTDWLQGSTVPIVHTTVHSQPQCLF